MFYLLLTSAPPPLHQSYPIMVEHIGVVLSWLPFAIVLLLAFVWSELFMIETKDKTLEEIQEEIGSDLSCNSAYDNYESVSNYGIHPLDYSSSSKPPEVNPKT